MILAWPRYEGFLRYTIIQVFVQLFLEIDICPFSGKIVVGLQCESLQNEVWNCQNRKYALNQFSKLCIRVLLLVQMLEIEAFKDFLKRTCKKDHTTLETALKKNMSILSTNDSQDNINESSSSKLQKSLLNAIIMGLLQKNYLTFSQDYLRGVN